MNRMHHWIEYRSKTQRSFLHPGGKRLPLDSTSRADSRILADAWANDNRATLTKQAPGIQENEMVGRAQVGWPAWGNSFGRRPATLGQVKFINTGPKFRVRLRTPSATTVSETWITSAYHCSFLTMLCSMWCDPHRFQGSSLWVLGTRRFAANTPTIDNSILMNLANEKFEIWIGQKGIEW